MTKKTAKQVRVGDVVAWADVPDGAMVRAAGGHGYLYVRCGTFGWWCGLTGQEPAEFEPPLGRLPEWTAWPHLRAEVLALGLTGSETAADLRALAERFDRMWERVQVGVDEETVHMPAWEVARDLADCPRCEAPAGHACVGGEWLDEDLYGEVHDERLAAEQARNGEAARS